MTTFIKLFHLVAVAHFAYGIHAWHEITPQELKWRKYEFGGKLVYLTFINFVSSDGFLSTTCESFKANKKFFQRRFKAFTSPSHC